MFHEYATRLCMQRRRPSGLRFLIRMTRGSSYGCQPFPVAQINGVAKIQGTRPSAIQWRHLTRGSRTLATPSFRAHRKPLCRTDRSDRNRLANPPLPLFPVAFPQLSGIPSEIHSSLKSRQGGRAKAGEAMQSQAARTMRAE